MAARDGMADLIAQFRSLVNDAGSASFTDDRAQQILDRRSQYFYQDALTVAPQQVASGSVAYHVYRSHYTNLEGTASGTVYFRLYDSLGTAITSGYTLDADTGYIRFTANQAGSARYLDGRTFDLYAAVADGWRELATAKSGMYDFRVEGRQYSRSQWFKHCQDMAAYFDALGGFSQAVIERGDMC